jgi:hypothetical protein
MVLFGRGCRLGASKKVSGLSKENLSEGLAPSQVSSVATALVAGFHVSRRLACIACAGSHPGRVFTREGLLHPAAARVTLVSPVVCFVATALLEAAGPRGLSTGLGVCAL